MKPYSDSRFKQISDRNIKNDKKCMSIICHNQHRKLLLKFGSNLFVKYIITEATSLLRCPKMLKLAGAINNSFIGGW